MDALLKQNARHMFDSMTIGYLKLWVTLISSSKTELVRRMFIGNRHRVNGFVAISEDLEERRLQLTYLERIGFDCIAGDEPKPETMDAIEKLVQFFDELINELADLLV